MRNYRMALFGLFIALLISANALRADTVPKQRKFEFVYTASLEMPEGTRKAELWLPIPQSDQFQEITNLRVKSEYPISFQTDAEYGNSLLFVSASSPKPGSLTVEVGFNALRREHLNRPSAAVKAAADAADPLMARWLQPDKLVPLNQRIKDLAAEATKGKTTDLEKARAIYDYAVANLKYDKSGTGWGKGDILFVCNEKRGNCADFHALVIGLCRVSGIPAKFEMGFSIPEDQAEAAIEGYHCWAEIYVKGIGWIPVDASEAGKHPEKKEYFFGAHDEHRIQFSIGRDIPLRPQTRSGPANFFIYPYAEMDDKPVEKIERKFAFKNL